MPMLRHSCLDAVFLPTYQLCLPRITKKSEVATAHYTWSHTSFSFSSDKLVPKWSGLVRPCPHLVPYFSGWSSFFENGPHFSGIWPTRGSLSRKVYHSAYHSAGGVYHSAGFWFMAGPCFFVCPPVFLSGSWLVPVFFVCPPVCLGGSMVALTWSMDSSLVRQRLSGRNSHINIGSQKQMHALLMISTSSIIVYTNSLHLGTSCLHC